MGTKQNVFIYDNCGINTGAKFICQMGRLIIHRNFSVSPDFTVITFNHKYFQVGQCPEGNRWGKLKANDVIVNEDVWIEAYITLCPGSVTGRGSIVPAGSVCVKGKEYPSYYVIDGNPTRFIRFRLLLNSQSEQENLLYNG